MATSVRVFLFRASYVVVIFFLISIYPEPWLRLGIPLEISLETALWPQWLTMLNSLWLFIAPLQPLIIVLLAMALWMSWLHQGRQKEAQQQAKQARIGTYQQLEARVYEGKPLFEKGMEAVEFKPVVDALYWQQQQLTALQQKQAQLDKHLAREQEIKIKLEQEKRKLSLSLLELKDTDKQRCEQISHLKYCFAEELAKLQERLHYYGELRLTTYQHWARLLPQLIETCQYLYLESHHPAHAMLTKELKCRLEDELDALVSYFDIPPEQAKKQWQMPTLLSPVAKGIQQNQLVSTAYGNHWQFILLGSGLSSLLEQLVEQGFCAELVSEVEQLTPHLSVSTLPSRSVCVIADCHLASQDQQDKANLDYLTLFDEIDAVLPPDTLFLAAGQEWSWHGLHQYQTRVDGLLLHPVSLFDVVRYLPISPTSNEEDSFNQLEHLLQTQLPKEQELTLLGSDEDMHRNHILDTEQHLLPEVPQALFDLAEAAEALAKEHAVGQNTETLIRLSEQLALPMLAVVAKELLLQHQQNKDISALCLVLWQCYQESVRAFNSRTEF